MPWTTEPKNGSEKTLTVVSGTTNATAPVRLDADTARPGETLIGFGPVQAALTLSASGDLTEAAARLFDTLRAADRLGRPIAVAPIPHHGLGLAINDRLTRAAAPRA